MQGRGRGKRRMSGRSDTPGTSESMMERNELVTHIPQPETPNVPPSLEAVGSSHAAEPRLGSGPTASAVPLSPQPAADTTHSVPGSKKRMHITMIGETFAEQSKVTRSIMSTLKRRYEGAWPRWTDVPVHVKDLLWTEFGQTFSWDPTDIVAVRRAWSTKIGKRISQEFSNARKGGYCPKWIREEFWNEMCQVTFSSDKFKEKCSSTQKNRKEGGGTGMGLSTCGSISIVEHEVRSEKIHGRKVYKDEAFVVSHQLQKDYNDKKKRDWVDPKAAQIFAAFQESLNEASQ